MLDIIRTILFIVITGCGVAIAKWFVSWVNNKIDEIQESVESEKLNSYIDAVQEAITTAVVSTSQTYVDSLKESGEFTDEAAETAKNMAIETALTLITQEGIEAVETVYGDFTTFLNQTIERLVRELKGE